MARETFQIGDLTAVIGDNEGYEGHRAGKRPSMNNVYKFVGFPEKDGAG